MDAVIKKIKLKKLLSKYYFSLELHAVDGNVYVVDKPFLSDPVNFRKQVFGIMAACNQFDLLKLGSDSPVYKEVTGYYLGVPRLFENEKGYTFGSKIDSSIYFYDKMEPNLKKEFHLAADINREVLIGKGKIERISSASGALIIFFSGEHYSYSMVSNGQIYYGMGYPIIIGSTSDKKIVMESSLSYQSFILAIMKFYEVDDLLELSGNVNNYPTVNITVDNGKVVNITSLETGMGFSIGKRYEIINVFKPELNNNSDSLKKC